MTHSEFEKAKKRLEQAKQDIFWAINVLNNSGNKLNEYQLTPQETERIHQKFQDDLDEIQQALALKPSTSREISRGIPGTRSGYRETSYEVYGQPKIVGAIPPYDDDEEE
jgi:biopolymer transport protein ExbB/TolQ